MNYYLRFEIEGLPKTTNSIYAGHWRMRHGESQRWKRLVGQATLGRTPQYPLKKANLILTRESSAEPDFDGLVNSFKAVVDSLVHSKIIVDDKPSVIGSPQYLWKKGKKKEGKITVEVVGLE